MDSWVMHSRIVFSVYLTFTGTGLEVFLLFSLSQIQSDDPKSLEKVWLNKKYSIRKRKK